jgi:ribosomal protein S12 methylthiotransferase
MATVALCNLGCSKNQIDGLQILEQLRLAGHELTEDFAVADIIAVNTCAFIEAAKIEAIDKILELARYKKNGRCTQLIVCGCFSERYRQIAQRQLPEVDFWVGVNDWPKLIAQHFHTPSKPSFVRVLQPPRASQYLKIAEGCSHTCAYCAIPGIRGNYKSRTIDAVIEEASWLFDQGVKECILVSQDTSFYGRDKSSSLARLLEAILKRTRFPWIRMMYLHPAFVDDQLIRLVATEPRLCHYFDMPLQHGADAILKTMNRRPLSKGIRGLVERIRTDIPDAAIRTAFIVGFPGETQRHFEELLAFVHELRFDKVGVFPFSPEEGTPAFSMRPTPRPATTQRRCEMVMALQREISESINASKIGRMIEVIIDEAAGESGTPGFAWEGRSRWDAPEVDGKVYVKGSGLQAGDIATVLIQSVNEYDLFGEAQPKGRVAPIVADDVFSYGKR